MRNPDPPFIEIGLYFSELDSRSALEKVAWHFVENLGALPKRVFLSKDRPVLGRNVETHEKKLARGSDLFIAMREHAGPVHKLVLEKASKVIPNVREYISSVPISEKAVRFDKNPVAIQIEGVAFSRPASGKIPASAKKIGNKVNRFFKEVVASLSPSYGSITVEYGLECPRDLKSDPRSLAFRDFYIAESFIGAEGIRSICKQFPGVHHCAAHNGQFTFSSGLFSPIPLDSSSIDGYELSQVVAEIIAKTASK